MCGVDPPPLLVPGVVRVGVVFDLAPKVDPLELRAKTLSASLNLVLPCRFVTRWRIGPSGFMRTAFCPGMCRKPVGRETAHKATDF